MVISFILKSHTPQEKPEQILRIIGDKEEIGKQTIVDAAIQYLRLRDTIKINFKKIEIKALFTNKEKFKEAFKIIAENITLYSRKQHYHNDNYVNIIVVSDFSDLSSNATEKNNISIDNELG